jgi:hypothetical protein
LADRMMLGDSAAEIAQRIAANGIHTKDRQEP